MESLADFFAAVEADPAPLPVWVGDLYLEKHRGTFTSQAAVKTGNREGELALAAAELWSTVRPDGAPWPAAELDRAWKLLLVNQFHDILPGSSIHWVYQDAAADHAEVRSVADGLAATPWPPSPLASTPRARPSPPSSSTPRRIPVASRSATVPAMGYAVADLAARLAAAAGRDGRRVDVQRAAAGRVGRRRPADVGLRPRPRPRGARARPVGQRVPPPPRPARASTTPGTSTAPTSTTSRSCAGPVDVSVVEPGRVRFRRRFGGSHDRPDAGPGARLPAHRLRHRRRLARAPPVPEGRLPGRHPHRPGHVRDPVRPRQPPDAREHVVGAGPLRGVRPPLGRPVRGRVRRRPAQRLQVRLRRPGQRPAPVAAAGPDRARPGVRPGPPPLHLRPAPPRRRRRHRRTCTWPRRPSTRR